MRRERVFLRFSLIILVISLFTAFEVQRVKASGTIYIRADGSIDPPTAPISTGDNITYTFSDNINDSIVVERNNVVIDGNGYTLQGIGVSGSRGIDLTERTNVAVKNTEITAFGCGIYLFLSSNNSICTNNITANIDSGIRLHYGFYNLLSGNNITANDHGIRIEDSSLYTNISENNIANNKVGIWLAFSSNNVVSSNTFTNDGLALWDSFQNVVENNTVNGRPLVYLEGVANYTVADAGQVILVDCNNIGVENLNLSRTIISVQLWWTNNSKIADNTIEDNGNGIWLDHSFNNSVIRNNITANTWEGIELFESFNNNISENNMKNNGDCIWLEDSSSNIVSENNITDNDDGIHLDCSSDNSISGNIITNNTNGLYLGGSSNNSLSGNTITNNYEGINLSYGTMFNYSSNCNSIFGNNIRNNTSGIHLGDNSSNNVISGNNMTANSGNGIFLGYQSCNNTISGNNIRTNGGGGIQLYYSLNNTVSGNDITDNYHGIWLDHSSSSISGNNVTNHSHYGIAFYGSYNSSISGNNIRNNSECGIWVYSSSNNTICHNNFVDNLQQVNSDNVSYSGSVNVWHGGYPSGGNYWSDYNGTDANHDGISDAAYFIDANNTDTYPLMGMFSDFNLTLEHHVQTICNSAISDFRFNGTAIMFNVTGVEGTAGFCRIYVPTSLMNAIYRVTVNGTEVACSLLSCSNNTHSYLYFNYTHSTQEVIIIPEFPCLLVLPLFMITSLLVIIFHKGRRQKKTL